MVGDFPEDLKVFLAENINSVGQLEVLLLLKESPDKEWTAAAVSQVLYSQPEAAATRLAELRSRGLVMTRDSAERVYRYSPGTPERDRLLSRLADIYRERRVAVTSLIYSRIHRPRPRL